MALFDCLGPVEGYDIGIVKINETQLTKNINLNRLRQRKSIIKNYVWNYFPKFLSENIFILLQKLSSCNFA